MVHAGASRSGGALRASIFGFTGRARVPAGVPDGRATGGGCGVPRAGAAGPATSARTAIAPERRRRCRANFTPV